MTKIISFIMGILMSVISLFSSNTSKLLNKKPDVETVKPSYSELKVNSGDTPLEDTVKYAAQIKNSVQGVFTDIGRNAFRLSNCNMEFTHGLLNNLTGTLTDTEGNVFIENSFKTFYTDGSGMRHYFESPSGKGRVNVIRLGEYYYDCHIRDLKSGNFQVDKNYHVYGDRIYSQYYLYSKTGNSAFDTFGTEISIPKSSVTDYKVDTENGFVAFKIKNVGVVGFIIPCDGSTEEYYVDSFGNNYIFTQTADCGDHIIPKYDSDEVTLDNPPYITFGSRIYTDSTDNYDGVMAAAYEERHPLTDITVGQNNADCKYIGYDSLRGVYTFTCQGTDFNVFYRDPEFQYEMPVTIKGDGTDRNIYIRFFGQCGCLEAGAVLDGGYDLVPIDVEVCKNFVGDGGEEFYSKKDFQYGDSFIPMSVKSNSENNFYMLHLYNGWGKYQLKQLSSIEFHVSYYHLSTGTTESNCIAPYSVSNTKNDGWLLPDFRTRSGNVWSGQPQYNSVGVLKFMVDDGKYGEFSGSRIDSCGQVLADVTDYYTAASGKYSYSLRHVEFPSNDENRTFYTIKVEFNEDVSFNNFKKNFNLFSFNGRADAFKKFGYLNTDNEVTNTDAITGGKDKYFTLGTDKPYYSLYCVTDETAEQVDRCFGCNFGYIILDSEIISQGKKSDIPFAVRLNGTNTDTQADLTLDTDKISFSKGDTITMNVILLPNGVGKEDNDSHTISVRNEERLVAEGGNGTKVDDSIVPAVKAVNNVVEFTVRGGKNMTAVRVDNITKCSKPEIYRYVGGEWVEMDNSVHGYDGYSITVNTDGTYSISFVYDSDGREQKFRVMVY